MTLFPFTTPKYVIAIKLFSKHILQHYHFLLSISIVHLQSYIHSIMCMSTTKVANENIEKSCSFI